MPEHPVASLEGRVRNPVSVRLEARSAGGDFRFDDRLVAEVLASLEVHIGPDGGIRAGLVGLGFGGDLIDAVGGEVDAATADVQRELIRERRQGVPHEAP